MKEEEKKKFKNEIVNEVMLYFVDQLDLEIKLYPTDIKFTFSLGEHIIAEKMVTKTDIKRLAGTL